MANKGKYQPRKVHTKEIIRFRGVAEPTMMHNASDSYVGSSDNLPSFRMREMQNRAGQDNGVDYPSGINTGAKLTISRVLGSGTLLLSELLSVLPPRYIHHYDRALYEPKPWDDLFEDDTPDEIIFVPPPIPPLPPMPPFIPPDPIDPPMIFSPEQIIWIF